MTSKQAHSHSPEQLEALLKAVPYGMVVLADTKVVFLNDAMVAILGGKTRKEFIGKSIWPNIAPEEQKVIKEHFEETLTRGLSHNARYHIKKPDGRLIPVEAASARILWQDTPAVQSIIWDITRDIVERRRTEDELQSWIRRYDLIVEASGQVAYECTLATEQITYGRSIEKVLGYPLSDIGKGLAQWQGLLHPEDRKAVFRELKAAEKICGNWDIRYRLRHKGGDYVWVRDRGFYVPNANGKASYQLGMLEDITENKRAEEALRESEEKYRSIFENASEGIYQSTPQGRYLSVNPAFARMLGFSSPDEMVENVTDIGHQVYVHWEDRERLKQRLAEQGNVNKFEVEVRRRDGEKIWLSINARAVRNPQGDVLYYEGTNVDITERKKAQESLAKNEQCLRDLICQLPDFIIIIKDLRFLFANDAALRGLKIPSREESRSYSLLDFIVRKEEKARAVKRIEEVSRSGRPNQPLSYLFKDMEGRFLYIEGSSFPVQWEGQDAIGIIAHDVTKEKEYLDNIRNSEQKYRSLVDRCVDGLVVHDQNNILYVNAAACQLSGYAFEEMLARPFTSFFDEDEEIFAERYTHVLSKNQYGAFNKFRDFSLVCKNGPLIPVEVCDSVIQWSGEPVILSFLRDKSERIRGEIEKQRFIKELEHKTVALEQKSIDLQDIINGVEEEKSRIARKVDMRVRKDILPVVKKLRLKGAARKYAKILEDRLQELLIGSDEEEVEKLSPQEREVCNLIRQGLASKQIAELLSVSFRTIDRHRDNIRKKLGIKNKKLSLSVWITAHSL